ncbi:MAG: T9SS type A sorting domain-containing protein [Candidatus Electryonea clarkiae]|nr:T9SS type A sorting domain-containing protein [Candidatus Electryonea clarkiae]MDP8288999.1 T9SS type A sorting domain-containing protein [Candidatus Electryonea clarkiae]
MVKFKGFRSRALIFQLSLVVVSSGFADIDFVKHVVTDRFNGVKSVYAVDIDRDGDADIIGAAANDNAVAWWENDGMQGFTRHTLITEFDGAISVKSADVDNDGDADIMAAAYRDGSMMWWENDGWGNFITRSITSNFTHASCIHAADLDGDSLLDFIGAAGGLANRDYGLIKWWKQDNNGGGTKNVIDDHFPGAISVFSADLDGDDDQDVIGAAAEPYNIVVWWENENGEEFTRHVLDYHFAVAKSVYADDMDRDGDIDIIAVATEPQNKIVLWENSGDGEFEVHNLTYALNGCQDVIAADIDGDGWQDIITVEYWRRAIRWWENVGYLSRFSKHTITGNFTGATSVYPFDIDSDGDIDVVGAAFFDGEIAWFENDLNPAAVLAYPPDLARINANSLTVRWSVYDYSHKNSFIVEWSALSDFPPGGTNSITTKENYCLITGFDQVVDDTRNELDELPEDIAIYWRVKVVRSNGIESWAVPGEQGRQFKVDIPNSPDSFELIGHVLNGECRKPGMELAWHPSHDPDPYDQPLYDIWLDTIPDLSTAWLVDENISDTSVCLSELPSEKTCYWTVHATDSNTPGTWASDTMAFSAPFTGVLSHQRFSSIPEKYSITSIYPNPFNSAVRVVFGIPEYSNLEIKVFNLLGERIAILTKGEYQPGYHEFTFNAENQSSGIYFIQAVVPGKYKEIRKVVLTR